MVSFLSEVLIASEKMQIEEVSSKCEEVKSRLKTTESEVVDFLEDMYVRFTDRPKENKELANKVNHLQEDLHQLVTTMDEIRNVDLTNAQRDFEIEKNALIERNLAIGLMQSLMHFHESLLAITQLQNSKDHLSCMEKIAEVEALVAELDTVNELEVLQELKLNLLEVKSEFIKKLKTDFEKNVRFEIKPEISLLSITKDKDQLQGILKALFMSKTVFSPLNHLGMCLLECFERIVDNEAKIQLSDQDNFIHLEVKITNKQKPGYQKVFSNLKKLSEFLSQSFNIQFDEEISTLSFIGEVVGEQLIKSLIAKCLNDTIPENDEALKAYKSVIEATQSLEAVLKEGKLIAAENNNLTKFVNSADVYYFNKKCVQYIKSAQEFMKKDLHDLVEVGVNSTSFEDSWQFPHSSISKHVPELLNFLKKVLKEALTMSESCSTVLINCVNDICLNYIVFVPEHHKKFLDTIPQQIALFYNNCMYISFNFAEWQKLLCESKVSYSFITTKSQIEEKAAEKFTLHVESQIKQIEGILKEAWCQELTLNDFTSASENAMRQCLRQQELLRTVWQKVLPQSFYNKTLGIILDSFCKAIIDYVLKYEDISSNAAEDLVEVLSMVQKRSPKLFAEPKEVNIFVPSWYKLNEIIFVLNANLVDIEDRWADGKGPLGMHLTAEELKKLVRALFQNTEMRAALLVKIVD